MDAQMNNPLAQRKRRRKSLVMTVLALVLTAAALSCLLMPFVTFTLNKTSYTFQLWQVLTGYMNVRDTLISLPLTAKAGTVLLPLLALAGGVLTLLKKHTASAVCYALSALCPLVVMMAANTLSPQFIDAGISTVSVAYHTSLLVMLAALLLAAVLAMWAKGGEKLAESIFLVFACLSVGSVVIITVYMIAAGAPALSEIGLGNFLFGTEWVPSDGKYGIAYMILSSIVGMLGAILIGVPIGLLTAVFLAELAPRRLAGIVRPAVELLAGIPSVIYGFFGMMIIVPAIRRVFPSSFGDSLLAMVLILAIMVLPTIISVSETALRAVPGAYREASLALGNTRVGTIFGVTVPAAKSGILAGVILGVGRAIGETMAVVMVCGNVVQFPQLLNSVRPLTSGVVLEMSYSYGLHRQALFSIGLILFIFIMIVNIAFTIISRRGVQISGKE